MRNKLIKVLMMVMFLICIVPTGKVFAATTSGDLSMFGPEYATVHWSYDSDTNTVTISGSGDIPNMNNNYSMYQVVGFHAFENAIIEEGITGVGDYAFYYSLDNVLANVKFPSTLKRIGNCSFQRGGPFGVTVNFTGSLDGLQSIGNYAFYYTTAKSLPELPSTLTNIGSGAFQYAYSLNGLVNKAKTSQSIGDSAFYGLGNYVDIDKRVVSAYSDNTSFVEAINGLNLSHTINYLDATKTAKDSTLDEWLAASNSNTIDSWFAVNTMTDYILSGGTAFRWASFRSSYNSSQLGSHYGGSAWGYYGGSISQWTNTGGDANLWISSGASGSDWVAAGGDQNSFIASGGTLEQFQSTDKNYNMKVLITVEATDFDVVVPLVIVVQQLADGTVITPDNVQVINNSPMGLVKISEISLDGQSGWKIVDYTDNFITKNVSVKEFSIAINSNHIDKSTKKIPIAGTLSNSIAPGQSQHLELDVKMGARGVSIDSDDLAKAVVVVGWDYGN